MRLSKIALASVASACLAACVDTPATSTDTSPSSESNTGAGSSTLSDDATSTTNDDPTSPPTTSLPTTSLPTTSDSGDTTTTTGICGDGIVDPGEQCDAGDDNGPGHPCSSQCQLSTCGDGELGPGEECDDGADNADNHSCTADCAHNICGDGKVGPGEGCDDGNTVDDDACTADCALASCGDRVVDATEQCDDGNDDDTDACTSACTLAACSDGFLQPGAGEQCDAGLDNADDAACTSECTQATCGDGHVWTTDGGAEECDSGPANGPGELCNAQCQWNVCGDGDLGPDEQCDDGGLAPGDGCSATCEHESCGNTVVDPGEQCDDGQDGDNADGCTDACTVPTCGDGIVQPGEQCDFGGFNSDSGGCTLACKHAVCGDGLVHDPIEQCDEGPNNGPGKACKANCADNYCGDGDKGPGEGCDDGNANNADGCTNACKAATCGDGIVQAGEACDLGGANANTGDCTLACALPTCGDGFVQPGPGETCDDGNTVGGDGCPANCQEALGEKVLETALGDRHICARLADGRVKCWGWNSQGATGRGIPDAIDGDEPGEMGDALPYVDLGTGVKALALAAGFHHTCAIVTGGHVKCWGTNSYGQLGLGDNLARGSYPDEMGDFLPYVNLGAGKTATAISAGDNFTCVILTGGGVKCWGHNEFGKLGLGDVWNHGDKPGSMGDNLPFVDLGTGRKAMAIDLGTSHACALLDNSTIKCWGQGGLLGLGDQKPRGYQPGEMGDNLPALQFGIGKVPVGVAVGDKHACALLVGGLVKCWGNGMFGALGYEDEERRGDGPDEMGDFLPVVKLGQGKFAKKLTAGYDRTCALLTDHSVKCWGEHYLGFTGEQIGDSANEMGDKLPLVNLGTGQFATDINSNFHRVCVLLPDDRLKCWGHSYIAGLGYGDTQNRGHTNASMGDNLPFIEL